jgi:hypothetical protein
MTRQSDKTLANLGGGRDMDSWLSETQRPDTDLDAEVSRIKHRLA